MAPPLGPPGRRPGRRRPGLGGSGEQIGHGPARSEADGGTGPMVEILLAELAPPRQDYTPSGYSRWTIGMIRPIFAWNHLSQHRAR